MRELVVVAFDNLEDARRAMQAIRTVEQAGKVRLEDTAIVERDLDGTAHIRGEASATTEA